MGRTIRSIIYALSVMMILSVVSCVYAETDISGYKSKAKLNCTEYVYDGTAKEPTVEITGLTLNEDYTVAYKNNINPGYATVVITGNGSYSGSFEKYFKISRKNDIAIKKLFGSAVTKRIAGADRYETSLMIANEMKYCLDIDKFDNIVIACGFNYPDALSGSYLAQVKNAPLITVNKDQDSETQVINYIKANLADDGTVFILGSKASVRDEFKSELVEADINVERIEGSDRFETNIEILREVNNTTEDLFVCYGYNYADSLPASAIDKPIILVDTSFNSQQLAYLQSINPSNVYVLGGEGTVKARVISQLTEIYPGTHVERISGINRIDTANKVADEFFDTQGDCAALTYAWNFPDGLSMGPLAQKLDIPILLADNSDVSLVRQHVGKTWINKIVVTGGPELISDSNVTKILER